MNLAGEADAADQADVADGKRTFDQGNPRGLQQKKKAAPPKLPIQDMIPYPVFYGDVTKEQF